MWIYFTTFLIHTIKIIIILRLIAYGSNRILQYLMWKHEKRLASKGVSPHLKAEFSDGKNKSLFRRYVSILVGSGVLGLFIVRRVHPDYRKPGKEASKWEVTVYTLLPLRIMSRLWGALTNIDLPVFLRPKIYSLYATSFGVNLDECQVQDLTCYKNLSEFFIRPLKEECRPVNQDFKCVVSPADGRVLTFGKITSCQVDQVKGVTYSLQQFLGKQSWKKINSAKNTSTSALHLKETDLFSALEEEPSDEEGSKLTVTGFPGHRFEPSESVSSLPSKVYLERLKESEDTDLYHCVVYLAPGDYHRFHSPVSWKVNFRRHFQGKLLSVNPAVASWINNLFSLNERVVYVGSWEHGFFSLTAVGATNVGFIKVAFDPLLHTNRWIVTPREQDLYFTKNCQNLEKEERKTSKVNFEKPVEIKKGELFGEFRLGSTIVLIFEAPRNFQFNIEKGQKIKYGEKIGFSCS